MQKKFQIPFGILDANKDSTLNKMREKPVKTFFANTGLYIFNSRVFKMIKKNKKTDINHLIELLKKGDKK